MSDDLAIPPAFDRRGKPEGYDADDDARRSYDEAVRAKRLEGVASGEFEPRPEDAEEMAAAPSNSERALMAANSGVRLVRYDAACKAIAEAKSVDEAKDFRDKAEAMRAYARQARNKELEADAAEIRFRAERRLGELIAAQKETVGLAQGKRTDLVPERHQVDRPTLAEAGIDKKLSSRAQKLAAIPEDKFDGMIGEWRGRVEKENERVTVNLLKAGERAEQNAGISEGARTLPEGKYGVIYADPPWTFKVWSGEGKDRAAENHYPTMTQAEIEALPVGDLAADDCALFLWAVWPQLPEALAVIEAWGFTYKTCAFVWAKSTKDGERFATGMGYWTRANSEVCLLATRGSPKRLNADVHQIVSPRTEHSRKPDEVPERIVRLVDGPYIELFARRPRAGWHVWGNQA